MKRDPYPLSWPNDTLRAALNARKASQFKVGFVPARNALLHELELLGAANVVITSDLPTRGDGLPIASARVGDPGIAVWFVLKGQERVFACDRWLSPTENMQALALTIAAMRGIERWGVAGAIERAFAGFAALPPGSSGTVADAAPARSWREVLNMYYACEGLERGDQLVLARARHRAAIKGAHPDAGGSHELAAELNAALAAAEAELSA